MGNYFMLECYGYSVDGELASIQKIHGVEGINWMLGRKIDEQVPKPIKITLDPQEGIMLPVYKGGILLFSDKLIAALQTAGVDNIHCYETELANPKTKETFNNYKAINIIGVVAAADLDASECEAHGEPVIDVDFDSLTVDESKAHDLLLFRLAECVSGIVVNEKVKACVEKAGIEYIDWIDPKDWIG